MDDLISRQAAIKEVHGAIHEFFDICDDDEESPMTYKDEKLLEINKAISGRIKALPSAQPEQRWIPCSERLPEDVKNGEEYPTLIYCTGSGKVDAGWYEAEVHKWWDLNCDVTVDNVIAWMPLPKPFRGDNNEIN